MDLAADGNMKEDRVFNFGEKYITATTNKDVETFEIQYYISYWIFRNLT